MAATPSLAVATGFITVLFLPLPCLCQLRSGSYYYDSCAPFTCGNVTIEFPFTSSEPFCGLPGFEVSCPSNTPTLELTGKTYQVKNIYRSLLDSFIILSDAEIVGSLRAGDCGSVRRRALAVADVAPLELPPWRSNLTSFVCPSGGRLPPAIETVVVNHTGCVGEDHLFYYPNRSVHVAEAAAPCTEVILPVGAAAIARSKLSIAEEFLGMLAEGFPLLWQNQTACWECEAVGGRCGYNQSIKQVVCFHCKAECGGPPGRSKKPPWKIITAAGVPGALVMLTLLGTLINFREKARSFCYSYLSSKSVSRSDSVDVNDFIKIYRSSLVSEYSYLDLKKMTDGFKEKLGEGGCGAVYKGKLLNGQLIAVKLLEKSNSGGRDFVNEVATIGRIHHVNIIRLMGFCSDGSRRALVYEFMPNGSLDDLISKQDLRRHREGADLLNIAVGIARGVEYLHQGCDTRILHLDIKPHNVLLDSNFNPKISDFGLAKLYSRRDSAVSLTGARGTIGYISPELFLRNLGAVSDKSDVYSYGMLLLEMIVGRKRIRAPATESSSKLHFPRWIYDQLEEWREMELGSSIAVPENLCNSRKMVMVGLWCIQTNPIDRPSITQVLEMLTGGVDDIDLPPKPTLFSMPRESHRGTSSVDSHADTLFYTVKSSLR